MTCRVRLCWFLLAVWLPALTGCYKSDIRISGFDGEDVCSVVSLGHGWRELSTAYHYEFRRAAQGSTELLVGVKEPVVPPVYFAKKFAFNPSNPARVRPATDLEWEKATPIELSQKSVAKFNYRLPTGVVTEDPLPRVPEIEYVGKRFPKRGEFWARADFGAILSPDGRWLAIQTYDGKPPPPEHQAARGYLPGEGRFFVDLYEVATARKRVTIRGEFEDISASEVWQDTAWLMERYLVLQFHIRKEAFVLCDMGKLR